MQHNWWLAVFEHIGLLTREEAQRLSADIKTRIHKDNYVDTFHEVEAVLAGSKLLTPLRNFKALEADVAGLRADLQALKKPAPKK